MEVSITNAEPVVVLKMTLAEAHRLRELCLLASGMYEIAPTLRGQFGKFVQTLVDGGVY